MNTYYDNILIPVDQSLNTQKAVEKAIRLAKPWRTTVHLVHLLHSFSPLRIFKPASTCNGMLDYNLDEYIKTLIGLMHWKEFIENNSHGIAVRIHIKTGFSLKSLVLQTTQKEHASLIIMARNPKRKWFSMRTNISVSLLAQKTGCPILCLETDVHAGLSKEVETLSKPLYIKKNPTRNWGFAGFSLATLRELSK